MARKTKKEKGLTIRCCCCGKKISYKDCEFEYSKLENAVYVYHKGCKKSFGCAIEVPAEWKERWMQNQPF